MESIVIIFSSFLLQFFYYLCIDNKKDIRIYMYMRPGGVIGKIKMKYFFQIFFQNFFSTGTAQAFQLVLK